LLGNIYLTGEILPTYLGYEGNIISGRNAALAIIAQEKIKNAATEF
jgi:hypothetical protein